MNTIMHINRGEQKISNHAPLMKQTLLRIKTPGGVDRNNRVASLYFASEKHHINLTQILPASSPKSEMFTSNAKTSEHSAEFRI